jgi:DNA-binding NtrC family response regulator
VQPGEAAAAAPARPAAVASHLEELERQHIRRVLDAEHGNKARAARTLGISRRRLYRLLAKHGLGNGHPEAAGTEPSRTEAP